MNKVILENQKAIKDSMNEYGRADTNRVSTQVNNEHIFVKQTLIKSSALW